MRFLDRLLGRDPRAEQKDRVVVDMQQRSWAAREEVEALRSEWDTAKRRMGKRSDVSWESLFSASGDRHDPT